MVTQFGQLQFAHILAGYTPLIDRKKNSYLQVVLREPDPLAGLPAYLRIMTKPIVDALMAGRTSISRKELLAQGGGLIWRDITDMNRILGNCTCTKDSTRTQPWAALHSHMPIRDLPNTTRHRILTNGGGITLMDVSHIQKGVGVCTCDKRKTTPPL